jgi:Icc-related predicted phosphoesterase
VLVVHSPPKGHLDKGFGSEAILETIEAKRPQVAVFGHIHECWGEREQFGATLLANLGPAGTLLEVAG